jgi:hypothetical protein
MAMRTTAGPLLAGLVLASSLAITGTVMASGQQDIAPDDGDLPAAGDESLEGSDQDESDGALDGIDTACPGDGDAVDTPEEITEFENYDSDELYVLDDDNDCADDDLGSNGYSAASDGPFRSPGILPLVAAGLRPTEVTPQPPRRMVTRSAGGERVNDAEVPWQVQIFQPWTAAQLREWGVSTGGKALWEYQHLCGATLVADNWALTASHCLPPSGARTGYRVRLGAETIHNDSAYTYRIDRVVPFSSTAGPLAGGIWRMHDISLIHFTDDRGVGRPSARQVRPIALDHSRELTDNMAVYATGWGRINNRTSVPTSTMMKVQLNIVANPRCAQGPWGQSFIHDLVICAAAPGRQTCQGDSGGPLVNSIGPPRLVGVVSWNNADCIGDVGRQGVYTRVARYADWIERTIRN